MGLLYDKLRAQGGRMFRWAEGDSGGFGGGSEGPDPAGGYSGGAGDSGTSDSAAPGQTAPGPAGQPGISPSDYDAAQFGIGPTGLPGLPAGAVDDVSLSPANFTTTTTTSVNLAQLATNVVNGLLGLLGIVSATPAGVIGGGRTLAGVVSAPSAFSSSQSVAYSGPVAGGSMETSNAPSVNPGGAAGPSIAAGGFSGYGGTAGEGAASGVEGAPVLGFSGQAVNVLPGLVSSSNPGSVGLPLLGAARNNRYGMRSAAVAAPAVPPGLVVAALAGLLTFGN